MKRIHIIRFAVAALLGTGLVAGALPVRGQDLRFGGLALNRDILMPADLAGMSQTQPFGTARAMAMGGAFTSLGADLTSLSLNPAGLGMYRRNELSVTPLVSVANTSTEGTAEWLGSGRTRFGFANVGVALNLYQSASSKLVSMTFGFGLNRIADFNSRTSFSSPSQYDPAHPDRLMPTIADVFGQQLGQAGIWPAASGSLGYDRDPAYWPAILGYNGYLLNVEGTANDPLWVPSYIGHNASVIHSADLINSGSINEISLSVGGNINNYLYFGFSLGVQSLHRKSRLIYQEEYRYPETGGMAVDAAGYELLSQLDYSSLAQQTMVDGSGVNFKVGLTARPVAGLRIGVAFHSPTYYVLDLTYRAEIETLGHSNESGDAQLSTDATPVQADEGAHGWSFVSPSRLLAGVSYTFGSVAILSVDYERDWYNGIRVKNMPNIGMHPAAYKSDFKQNYQATNTLRAGVEVKPLPLLALRAGYGCTSSMFKDQAQQINGPSACGSHWFSAGLGVNLGRNTVLDVAYQQMRQSQTAYELFFSNDTATGAMFTHSGLYETRLTRHHIALSLNYRF